MSTQRIISVIGLGYVGLPVAVEFAKQGWQVIGYDINPLRIAQLKQGIDATLEILPEALSQATLTFTHSPELLKQANFHIIAVPTPVDEAHNPDLKPVLSASKILGSYLKKQDIVVYESTVYPGATEERCVPVLERYSGLQCPQDFYVGYSPERINPGDKNHHFSKITKVVSGINQAALEIIADVYASVVSAGVHRASSIRVAEAAKVIENTQRDVNIALINELAMIFQRMGIDTHDVLTAAQTKWNFMPFKPGLVGGHCIGVDPYYLVHKAQQLGYTPQVIPAARQLNQNMGAFIAQQTIDKLQQLGCLLEESVVTILGLAFKENVPDLRNTRVVDIVEHLQKARLKVQVYDPLVNAEEAKHEYNIELVPFARLQKAQCVILAVAHHEFVQKGWQGIQHLLAVEGKNLVIDVKGILARESQPEQIVLWRL